MFFSMDGIVKQLSRLNGRLEAIQAALDRGAAASERIAAVLEREPPRRPESIRIHVGTPTQEV